MRVFIIGSCVSRDLLSSPTNANLELTYYAPRQSVIPLLGRLTGLERYVDSARLTSRFQRRALEGTLSTDFMDRLQHHRNTTDMLLWDITDERLGVYESQGKYVTRSLELASSGIDALVAAHARHVPFGTDEHFELWSAAVAVMATEFSKLDLTERVVLVAPRWATAFEDGSPTPPSFGLDAATFERLAQDYYAQARHLLPGVRLVGRDLSTTASTTHHWGPAAFHFSKRTSDMLIEETTSIGFDPKNEFPLPIPTVIRKSATAVHVGSPKTWGSEFALYVLADRKTVKRFRYQDSPNFQVTDLTPGTTYRFRIFHRNGDRTVAISSDVYTV